MKILHLSTLSPIFFTTDAIIRQLSTIYDIKGNTVSYTYDKNGNVTTVTDKNGTISREFDELNRVVKYTDTLTFDKLLSDMNDTHYKEIDVFFVTVDEVYADFPPTAAGFKL